MSSIIAILGLVPLIVVFFICFLLTLKSYLKNSDSIKIFLMIWTISVCLTYICWLLRVLILDQYESNQLLLYPYWAICYFFGGLALIGIDFATLNMSTFKNSIFMKYISVFLVVTYLGVVIFLLMGFDMSVTVFMTVNDLTISDPIVQFYFNFVIILYIIIPNVIFLNFLRKEEDKTSFIYKRVRIIELGMLLFCIGIAGDGMRLGGDAGILIFRVIMLIGGIVTMKGYLMKA